MQQNSEGILSTEQIQSFQNEGILVIPNILSSEEISDALENLHSTLLDQGVDTNNLKETGHNLVKLSSTNGSGGVLDLFYPNFKLDIATNETLFKATSELWRTSYRNGKEEDGENQPEWMNHPYENFDCSKGYAYLDRIGFRLPTSLAEEIGMDMQKGPSATHIGGNLSMKKNKRKRSKLAIQRSLTPHLDNCPDTINSKDKSKWRPIQCFISLTDNLDPNTGGFEAVMGGFHKEFQNWAKTREKTKIRKQNGDIIEINPPCIGEYTHIRPKEDGHIMKRVEHIPVRAGSAVLWDNRIPHANAYKNESDETRIVIYCSFLPDIEINRDYAKRQLEDFKNGKIPRDQWIEIEDNSDNSSLGAGDVVVNEELVDESYQFTSLGRKLMTIDEW